MLCEAPYLGITIDPAGNINMCCNTMDREQFGTKITDIDNLEEFFQSKQYDKLRNQMSTVGMEGIKNCEVCWIVNQGLEAEITNYHSRAEFVVQGGIPEISAPDSRKKFSIKNPIKLTYLEMTTSNVCNQTCVMCDSFFSTKWKKIEHHFKRGVNPTFSMSDESVAKILDVLPKLKILQIKGGEPFADKNNLKILTRLAQVNPDCKVILVSNFQHIPDEWWPVLMALNCLQVGASIDGTHEMFDWIRGGSFDKVTENIKEFNRLVDCKFGFSINMCISIYNLYNIKATQEYFKDYTCNVYNVVQSPMHLSPSIVSKDKLQKIIEDEYGDDKTNVSPNLLNINYVIDKDLVDKFYNHTKTMNMVRGFDVYDIEPRLKTIFDE
jgi:radical SAM protein with 4Fe4S-binding SPASM domain